MDDVRLIDVLDCVDERFILEAEPSLGKASKTRTSRLGSICRIVAAAVVVLIVASVSINVVNPTMASNLPIVGSVFEYIQKRIYAIGDYKSYATSVNEIQESNGVSVTLAEVYCDGYNMFVSYKIQSKKAFKEYGGEYFRDKYMNFKYSYAISTDSGKKELINTDINGLEGEFVNENTFVGYTTYNLKDEAFPEKFNLVLQISDVGMYYLNTQDKLTSIVNGMWKFDVPVEVNKSELQVIEVNESKDGKSIDKIIASPTMITIYSSYPAGEYKNNANYTIWCYTQNGTEDVGFMGNYYDTEGVTWISRKDVKSGDVLTVYFVDVNNIDENDEAGYFTKEFVKKYAVVEKTIVVP